ncbi:MAG: hypothetical protein ACK4WD_10455 [Flavobacteriales bacterium]|jgi:hypothetical protein
MKGISIGLFFFLVCFSVCAQRTDDDYVTPSKPEKRPWVWNENLFYGGGLGLAFGNITVVNVNPQIGVKVLPWLGAGVGFDYNFVGNAGRNLQTFGPTSFVRLRPLDFIIAQAEITQVFVRFRENTLESNFNFPMALVGLGYQEGTREGGGFFIMIMTDLIGDPRSPFPPLTFRTGFSIGF